MALHQLAPSGWLARPGPQLPHQADPDHEGSAEREHGQGRERIRGHRTVRRTPPALSRSTCSTSSCQREVLYVFSSWRRWPRSTASRRTLRRLLLTSRSLPIGRHCRRVCHQRPDLVGSIGDNTFTSVGRSCRAHSLLMRRFRFGGFGSDLGVSRPFSLPPACHSRRL